MGYRFRRRRRRIRLTIALIATLLCCVFLVSCMASANVTWVRGLLGYDVTDYEAEETIAELSVNDERGAELCEMVEILTADHGLYLEEFETTSEAVSLYRDAILGYMLRNHYSRYTGDREMTAAVALNYPQMQASTLVPAEDFENTVFRYFGGISVRHEDGDLYSYLNRSGCYTAPMQKNVSNAEMNVQSLEETEHTYRMTFTLTENGRKSTPYTAVFLKRDDGTCYFRSLAA